MELKPNQILQIKKEIDDIKEYIESDLCKKCEEMKYKLDECEKLLKQYLQKT